MRNMSNIGGEEAQDVVFAGANVYMYMYML